MSGDPSNARLWADADVYVSFDLDAVNPSTINDDFGVDWDLVGILDADAGFTQSRNMDEGDLFGWGMGIVRTSRRNFKLTYAFTALEDNPTTFRLAWPGSTRNGTIVAPTGNRIERVKVAFEKRDDGTGVVHRLISYYQAEITVNGDITENESTLAATPFLATIFPDGDGNLFHEQRVDDGS